MLDLPTRDPAEVPLEELRLPEPDALHFEGWQPEVFDLLADLRTQPHIDYYRERKEDVRTLLKEPFKRYRDDAAAGWVLPNRLGFETEKNVFSRILKNDFGAGGVHHHLWMAFYRPPRRRLTDLQLSHSLHPDGLDLGLYVGGYAKDLLHGAKTRLTAEPEAFLKLLNPLLRSNFYFAFAGTRTRSKETERIDAPLDELPEDLQRAQGIWLRTTLTREEVLAAGGEIVRQALERHHALWPVYRFLAGGLAFTDEPAS